MDFSGLMALFQSAPKVVIFIAGAFTIGALIYNVQNLSDTYVNGEQKDTFFVLSILSAILILGLMIVVAQLK